MTACRPEDDTYEALAEAHIATGSPDEVRQFLGTVQKVDIDLEHPLR